jgi:hypothetical protein
MKVMYINIDTDVESRDLTEAELARVGLKAERVSAITGDNRPLAFNKSVYKAMEMCSRVEVQGFHEHADNFVKNEVTVRGRQVVDNLLLFEDDVVFEPTVDLRGWDKYAPGAMPEGWMSCHLGCNIIGMDTTVWQMPTHHSEYLAKLWNCWQSHATLYSAECVKYILDNFRYVTDEYATEGCQIFDEWLRVNILPMGRSYVMRPMVAFQRPRSSAIWGNNWADYTSVHKRGNEYLSRL